MDLKRPSCKTNFCVLSDTLLAIVHLQTIVGPGKFTIPCSTTTFAKRTPVFRTEVEVWVNSYFLVAFSKHRIKLAWHRCENVCCVGSACSELCLVLVRATECCWASMKEFSVRTSLVAPPPAEESRTAESVDRRTVLTHLPRSVDQRRRGRRLRGQTQTKRQTQTQTNIPSLGLIHYPISIFFRQFRL